MKVVLATAFRLFFLLAGVWSVVALGAWSWSLHASVALRAAAGGVAWHGHELVWGFSMAVIGGFLLTAARAWTGRPTASGVGIAAIAALWLVDRVAGWTGGEAASILGAAFPMAVALAVGRPILAAKSWRNIGFIPLLGLLSALDLAAHLGWMPWSAASRVAVDAVVVVLAIVGGRIVPLFTRNAIQGAPVRQWAWLEWASLAAVWAVVAVDLWAPWGRASAFVAGVAGVLHLGRWLGWAGWWTRRSPILWVLHVGYAWIWIGFGLRAAVPYGVPASAALHALTAGAIGTLALGMMARVSLGHTGRPLVVKRPITGAFLVVTLAALLRVGLALASETAHLAWAGALFCIAFTVFVAIYTPALVSPRPDGREG